MIKNCHSDSDFYPDVTDVDGSWSISLFVLSSIAVVKW